jgi:hypothetical protein
MQKELVPWVRLVKATCEKRQKEKLTATFGNSAGVTYGEAEW